MKVNQLQRLATSMWTVALLVVLVIVLLVILVVHYRHKPTKIDLTTAPGTTQSSKNNAANPQPAPPQNACDPSQLKSSLNTSGAAGNIYGTYTITNTGTASCQIVGNNYLQASYPLNVKNLALSNQGAPGPTTLTLDPAMPIYATIHYPNGPQCSTATTPVSVTFSYPLSSQTNLTLSGENGGSQVTIQACQATADITTIEASSLSTTKPN